MSPALHATGLVGLSFGVPMALAIWEVLRPDRDRRPKRDGDPPVPRPPAPAGQGQRPLPDCLIPKLVARRPERVDA